MITRKAKAFFKESDLDCAEAWLEERKNLYPNTTLKIFKLRAINRPPLGLSDGPGYAIASGPAMVYTWNFYTGIADFAPTID